MPDPWFNPAMYSWIPGTFYGTLLGMTGALAGTLAPKGKAKKLVFGLIYFFLIIAIIFLILGITAYFMGQPYGIWYGFLLPGILGVVIIPVNLPVLHTRYREFENRKMDSQDL